MDMELGHASLGQTQHFIGETSFCFTVRIMELAPGDVFMVVDMKGSRGVEFSTGISAYPIFTEDDALVFSLYTFTSESWAQRVNINSIEIEPALPEPDRNYRKK